MNEIRVGVLAFAAMAAIVFMSLKITSNQSGFGAYKRYHTIIQDASGIFPKTPIKVAGINAGRLISIELEDNKAHITFEVLDKVKIPKGSKLKIKTVGFLGDKYLEIDLSDSTEILPEDSVVDALEGAGLEKLMKDASEVVADIKKVSESLKETFSPEGQEAPLKQIIQNTQDMVNNAKEVTESLKRVINGNEQKLNDLIANLENFSRNLKNEMDKTHSNSMAGEINDILDNTKKATEDLKAIVADIRNGKGTLGRFVADEEIADKVSQTLSGVNRLVNRFNSLRTEIFAYTGLNSEYGGDTQAGVRFYTSPERFYQLGISTSEFGLEKEVHTTTTLDGVTSRRIETTKTKNTYRFDFQIGKRLQNWSFRGGLIESTGGLGVDYFVNHWGSTFSGELFDYRSGVGINLRLRGEFQLWNVFYGRIVAEDILLDNRNYSFLAGLRFNDDDIRGLIGFFL